jgi:hypothetical protein
VTGFCGSDIRGRSDRLKSVGVRWLRCTPRPRVAHSDALSCSLNRDSGCDYREHWTALTGCASNGEVAPVCIIGQGSKTADLKVAMDTGLDGCHPHLALNHDKLFYTTESGNSNTEIFESYMAQVGRRVDHDSLAIAAQTHAVSCAGHHSVAGHTGPATERLVPTVGRRSRFPHGHLLGDPAAPLDRAHFDGRASIALHRRTASLRHSPL